MATFPVVLDSCVLFPALIRDTLLRAAEAGLYRVHWSQKILDDTARNLIARGKFNSEQAKYLITEMSRARNEEQVLTSVVMVHPTDPRDREMSEDVSPELIQKMLNIGDNFMNREDYKSFVFPSGRVGMMPASPLDLSSLERFQRLFRFYTLGIDILYGIHPSLCPVCENDLSSVRSQFKNNEGKCPNCEAKWSWRICNSCGNKVAKLEPLKMKPPIDKERKVSYSVHAMDREQLLGRDQLAALCESKEIPESGRLREICPYCGTCTGKGKTVQNCLRCRSGNFL